MKTSGFNLEKTHLNDPERIGKLLSLVIIAFTWAYLAGLNLAQNVPIKIKKHGRRAQSYFKYGLNYIANALINNDMQKKQGLFKLLSCT